MLNISLNSIREKLDIGNFSSAKDVAPKRKRYNVAKFLVVMLCLVVLIMFLPWTQTVPGEGSVTSLRPDQRPQSVQSVITGRIEEWYITEGQRVEKGDTLLFVSETKDEYFDPQLLVRVQEQIDSKKLAAEAYRDKANAMEGQIGNLETGRRIKLGQLENKILQTKLKVQSDSANWSAARTNYQIAQAQYIRAVRLRDSGLYSMTDLEIRNMKLQEAEAKEFSANNKFQDAQNEYLNVLMDRNAVANDYAEKIAKARAEFFTTISMVRDAEITVSKLTNQYANYQIRRGLYYVTAPQTGYITRAVQSGIGETIKAGQEIVTIMPEIYDLAVEMFIMPQDLPLVEVGSEVRLIFDGWPALVFSGWPGVSPGTFGGRVVAVDRFSSAKDGGYRLLVTPDPNEVPWPTALRPGSGVQGMVLLGDVSVGYEIWRQLNGFPPSFYEALEAGLNEKNDKQKTEEEGEK